MFKDKIVLNSINPLLIYGEENQNINFIKSFFPDLKITARGVDVMFEGDKKNVKKIKTIFSKLISYFEQHGDLTKDDIKQLIKDDLDDKIFSVDFSVIGKNGLVIKPRTINQRKMIQLAQKNNLLFVLGPAGTGKTYTAIALASKALKELSVKKIILTRPAVEAGENLGFLPGDLYEKLSPYMRPLYDALNDIFDKAKLTSLLHTSVIEIVPLAFMRGRTLDNAFVILDEAQNTTIEQMKMFLTRMGPSAQFIVCGDVSQVDLPKQQKSGLIHAAQILTDIDGVGFIKFNAQDVIRHKLVKSIIKAYKQ
ncbi:MAG: phosphate starvation-inducible protein PhoH [Flavobacteriales bacterium]|nr:phosphate starvation-inducible protein PhoH [Flavobacteriales bacterium]